MASSPFTEPSHCSRRIDAMYVCPHGWDEGCGSRKPRPGLFFDAQEDLSLDLFQTVFIGDDDRDEMAATGPIVLCGCWRHRHSDQFQRQSPNVINAARYAREHDLSLVTFTGFLEDNPLKQLGELNCWINSSAYNIVETTHQIRPLAVCDLVVGRAEYGVKH